MRLHTLRLAVLALSLACAGLAQAQSSLFELNFPSSDHPFPVNQGSDKVNPGIATGSSSGLYMRFGEDIAKLCANYGIPLTSQDPNRFRFPKFRSNVYATQGGFDSVKRLRYEREVQLAIVQSDLRYFASQRIKDEYDAKKREAWRQIADDIKLVLPLYKEKVHIVIRPGDKQRFRDLSDLMKAGARVNVGSISSGGMITCHMIQEIVAKSRAWKEAGNRTWQPTYHATSTALDMLVGKNATDRVDAVILVGGVPYPALEQYGLDWAIKKGLFKAGVTEEPQLALLPVGPEVMDILSQSEFGGYHPTTIDVTSGYKFLGQNAQSVETVGVYACLVTHAAYKDDAKRDGHKIDWVRHILFRVLTKLDPYSDYGLPHDFGVPKAGDKWKEVRAVDGLTTEAKWEELYGWPRHDDEILRQMVDLWAKGRNADRSSSNSNIVDPITLF